MSGSQSYPDEQLLQHMKQDDEEAFARIYRRYWEELFTTAAKVLRSGEDAADVVQDVFLSLWNRRKQLEITDSLEAYLQTSARYKSIGFIRKHIVRRDYLALLADVAVHTTAGSPELQVQFKEIERVIHDTVVAMPPKMREVYLLSRHEQRSHKEIAARLGISDETVKKHIQHALQLIRTAMGYASLTLAITLMQQLP